MKYLVLLSFLFSLGCSRNPKATKSQSIFIDQKLKEFIISYPNWNQNDLIKNKTDMILKDSLQIWKTNKSFLSGMPFRLEKVMSVSDKGKNIIVAYFIASPIGVYPCYEGERIEMKILGLVRKTDIESLTNGQFYELQGTCLKNLDSNIGLSFSDYNIGSYEFKIESFKQMNCESPN